MTEQDASRAEETGAAKLTGRILVVDDDPCFLRILSRILTNENFQVTTTTDACEAVESLGTMPFDLIISDLRMPECDGLSLLQAVRKAGFDIPIIILTSFGDVETYLEAMNAGATEYLNKPTKSFDEMLRVIRTCLNKSNGTNTVNIKIPHVQISSADDSTRLSSFTEHDDTHTE
jgi:two-component system, response regulator, stage 0 sporulation protein F